MPSRKHKNTHRKITALGILNCIQHARETILISTRHSACKSPAARSVRSRGARKPCTAAVAGADVLDSAASAENQMPDHRAVKVAVLAREPVPELPGGSEALIRSAVEELAMARRKNPGVADYMPSTAAERVLKDGWRWPGVSEHPEAAPKERRGQELKVQTHRELLGLGRKGPLENRRMRNRGWVGWGCE